MIILLMKGYLLMDIVCKKSSFLLIHWGFTDHRKTIRHSYSLFREEAYILALYL